MHKFYLTMGKKKPVDPNSIKVDGHDFNKKTVASFKTEADWMKHANDEDNAKGKVESSHKTAWFPGDPERDAKLKQVYKLATAKAAE